MCAPFLGCCICRTVEDRSRGGEGGVGPRKMASGAAAAVVDA